MQKLLRDKLERDLGRPLERSGGGGGGKSLALTSEAGAGAGGEMTVVSGGNVIPQEPEQVK